MRPSLRDLPIKRKLMLVTVLTSGFALLAVCAALIVYERMTFRREVVEKTAMLAKMVGANSDAALMFNNWQDADKTINTLRAEEHIVAAALYDEDGSIFAEYRSSSKEKEVPAVPGENVHVFSATRLGMFRPVINEEGVRVGTVYLRTDLGPMYSRFWFYGILVLAVGGCSALGAMMLSTILQRRISAPILELAAVSRLVSENADYSIRARRYGNDELGSLTDAFNEMLARIEESRSEVAASEQRLRLALEGSKMGTWDVNLLTGELIWDDHMYPLLGRTREQFAGTVASGLEAVHPGDRAYIASETSAAVHDRSDFNVSFRVVAEDGAIRYMATRGRAFYDPEGNPVRMSGVTMDVTASRQTELALQAAKETAEAANNAKDNFLAILSHELRTPLTPVLAAVAMIEEERNLSQTVREDIRMIRRNVEVEARLIDDLLDVTRVARGKLELHRHIVDARPLLEHALENYCKPEAARRKLRVEIAITAKDTHVMADPSRLTQVFWNLLQNACKFTHQGGVVAIRMFNEPVHMALPPELVIEVQDDGIGIDPEALPRIFDAFEQGERSRTRVFGGLGLGLAISRALVELHGGRVSARSDGKDHGATFTIRLHSVAKPAEGHAPLLDGKAGDRSNGEHRAFQILLVEDHPDTAAQLSRLLQRAGHRSTWASSLREARAISEEAFASGTGNFDLVVSDLGLPDGSGHDLMRELSAKYQLPGIALSGYGMEADVQESKRAGFFQHLTKPVDWQDLKQAIHDVAKELQERDARDTSPV